MPTESPVTSKPNKLRVGGPVLLVVTWKLQPYGGLETRLSTLVRTAVSSGWDVEIVSARPVPSTGTASGLVALGAGVTVLQDLWGRTAAGRSAIAAGRARESVRTRSLVGADPMRHGHRSFQSFVSTYWSSAGAALLRSADVVHLVGAPKEFLVGTMRAASANGTPVAYQAVHQVDEHYASRGPFAAFGGACNLCSVIFTSHDQQADGFRRHFGYRGRTVTVPQWCYEGEEQLLDLQLPDVSGDRPLRVGALARFDRVKGFDTVIDAVGRAIDQGVQCSLVLGGSGDIEGELREHAEARGVADRVEWSGYVADRTHWFDGIDVFVIASIAEGGPITGVEAMAAGRAIVTTPVGAMPERLEGRGAGLFFDAGDADALAAHLSSLAGDPELLGRLSTAARTTYVERYAAAHHRTTMLDELALLATLS